MTVEQLHQEGGSIAEQQEGVRTTPDEGEEKRLSGILGHYQKMKGASDHPDYVFCLDFYVYFRHSKSGQNQR